MKGRPSLGLGGQVTNAWRLAFLVGTTIGIFVRPVVADEQLIPLAVSGSWAALEHRDNLTSPPDVCILMNPTSGVALRAGSKGLEVRISDQKWSLPSGVAGVIQLKVGRTTKSFDIAGNTDTAVAAIISEPDMLELFDAMDQSSVMDVTAGKAKPRTVSLNGSSRAANAFRTCAGLAGSDRKGGENPFQ